MWASFTRTEKSMLLAVLSFLGAGSIALPYLESERRTEVFSSGSPPRQTVGEPGKKAVPSVPAAAALPGVAADGRIDLNTASAETLDVLPGVGPSRAAAILALRNKRGGFRSVEELDDVPGFGPATMAKLRELITVSSAPAAGPGTVQAASTPAARAVQNSPQSPAGGGAFATAPAPRQASSLALGLPPVATPGQFLPDRPVGTPPPDSAPYSSAPHGENTGPVNVNTATAEQLETLKYVGPKLAQAIIVHRTRFGAFRRPEDLAAVKGIGRRIVETNRGRILVR